MKAAYGVILTMVLIVASCQQLPTEPTPIDLSKEQPIAVADTAFTDEDVDVIIDVLANDSSLVGDNLRVTDVNRDPTEGSSEIISNKVRYTPAADFSGIDSLSYVVSGSVLSSSASVYVIVRPVNDPPIANDDDFQVLETGFASKIQADLDVLANDTDIEGDRLTVLRTTPPTNGQVEIPEGGLSVVYTPKIDFVGTDAFLYTIQDGNGGLDTAEVTISVEGSNDAPVAVNDSWAVQEDHQKVVEAPGVLGNDTDVDLDPLEAVLRQDVSHGDLLLLPDGSFTYQPDQDYTGEDAFQYIATDRISESNVATVIITVLPVNDRPIALADSYQINEDAELRVTSPGVLGNDLEPEGDVLTARLVSDVKNGTLTLSTTGSFTYVGAKDYFGTDSFTYVASDGTVDSNPADVQIEVLPVNDPPRAVVDSYQTNEDEPLTVAVPGVLSNDTDIDGDALTATLQTLPANGTVSLQSDGSFTYTPLQDFSGLDGFTYAANDGAASSVAAVTLQVALRNDAPVALDDDYETAANIELVVAAPGLLLNDSDAEGDILTVEIISDPQHGLVVLSADGSFRYTPNRSFAGDDAFFYQANDGELQSPPAEVRIRVTATGNLPIAADDFYSVFQGTVLVVEAPGVLGNDADDDQDVLTAVTVVDVAAGTLMFLADGSFTYEAPMGFTGLVTFAYRASDGQNVSNVAIVQLTVQ